MQAKEGGEEPAAAEEPAAEEAPAVEAEAAAPAEEAPEEPAAVQEEAPPAPEPVVEPEPPVVEEAPAAPEPEQPPAPVAEEKAPSPPPAVEEPEPEPVKEPSPPPAAVVEPPAPAAEEEVMVDYEEPGVEAAKRKREEEEPAPAAPEAAVSPEEARPEKQARTEEPEAPAAAREVPPSKEPATRALLIEGFCRPLQELNVRKMLDDQGTLATMWMAPLKTHAYAIFGSIAGAESARQATWGIHYPDGNPKTLSPQFVPVWEAEKAIAAGSGNPDFKVARCPEDGPDPEPEAPPAAPQQEEDNQPAPGFGEQRQNREWNQGRDSAGFEAAGSADLRELLRNRPGAPEPQDQAMGDAEAEVALDDLFKKTEAKPAVYWQPLSEEEVAAKNAVVSEPPAVPPPQAVEEAPKEDVAVEAPPSPPANGDAAPAPAAFF